MKRNRALKNKRSKDVAKKTPTLYGATIAGRKHRGYTATTSLTLMNNLIRKVLPKKELELFWYNPGEVEQIRTIINDKGKSVEITQIERAVIRAICLILDTMKDDERVKTARREAPARLRSLATRPTSIEIEEAGGEIKISFTINQLTNMIYPNTRLSGRNAEYIRNAVLSLAKKEQLFTFPGIRDGIVMPYYSINSKTGTFKEVKDKNGKVIGKKMIYNNFTITLSPIFLCEFNIIEPIDILNLISEVKKRTNLFDTLLDILETEHPFHIKRAREAAAQERKRLLDEAKTLGKTIDEVELKTKLDKVKRKYLTFDKYSVMNIFDTLTNRSEYFRIKTTKSKGLQEYLRGDAINKLKEEAQKLINNMHIITECNIGGKNGHDTKPDGYLKAEFIFNEFWIEDEKKRMKNVQNALE